MSAPKYKRGHDVKPGDVISENRPDAPKLTAEGVIPYSKHPGDANRGWVIGLDENGKRGMALFMGDVLVHSEAAADAAE